MWLSCHYFVNTKCRRKRIYEIVCKKIRIKWEQVRSWLLRRLGCTTWKQRKTRLHPSSFLFFFFRTRFYFYADTYLLRTANSIKFNKTQTHTPPLSFSLVHLTFFCQIENLLSTFSRECAANWHTFIHFDALNTFAPGLSAKFCIFACLWGKCNS